MNITAIIPARYASSRFEGKPLAILHGKPMIWWVYNQVKKVTLINKVVVALDDERIADICKEYNLDYVFTDINHTSSTSRVHEVSNIIDSDFYICINGDEPLIKPETIKEIIPNDKKDNVFVSNLMVKMKTASEVIDSTNIKVVFNKNSDAIFFSRSPIPYPKGELTFDYYKHIGVLCYNKKGLDFFVNNKKGPLEKIEDINELRFLENYQAIKMIEVNAEILSVDTPKDLNFVSAYMEKNNLI